MQVPLAGLGRLTTDHAASSYGLPVLVIDGTAYGPKDMLPSGQAAGEAVALWAADRSMSRRCEAAIRRFFSQLPPRAGNPGLGLGPLRRFPLGLPDDLRAELEQEARETGLSLSEVIRRRLAP